MSKNKFFLFAYAATQRVFINLVGRLMFAEILALVSLPFINVNKLLRQYRELRFVLGSLLLLLISQIISDFFNESDPLDFLRGWSVIIFSMISVIYLVKYLSGNQDNIVYYLVALFLIRLFFGEGEIDLNIVQTNTNYFKSRFVGFLNPAILLFSYYLFKKRKYRFASLLFLFFGFFCLIMDARSNGLIFTISGFLVYIKVGGVKFSNGRIIVISVFLSSILYLGYIYYVNQVLNNDFGGTNAKIQLGRTQNPYNPFELVMQGRSQFFMLLQAGLDKPLLGHGSWGKDPGGKYAMLDAEITDSIVVNERGYIYAHSVVMGYWAYAGIFGFLIITFLFLYLFRKSYLIYLNSNYICIFPIVIFLSVDMLWAFLFSPLGLLRTTFPIFASLIITLTYNLKAKSLNEFYQSSI